MDYNIIITDLDNYHTNGLYYNHKNDLDNDHMNGLYYDHMSDIVSP